MVKIRSGLLITLVLLSVAMIGTLSSSMARAGADTQGALVVSSGNSGSESGEPDTGQGRTPPCPTPKTSTPGKPDRRTRGGSIARTDWVRWVPGIWAARYLGVGY